MLRNFSRVGINLVNSFSVSNSVCARSLHVNKTVERISSLALCSSSSASGFSGINLNSDCRIYQPSRPYSNYVMKWEKMRRRRPRPPKDESYHYPDYMHEKMPNQEDNEETRSISSGVFEKINSQIVERSHGRLFAVVQLAGKQFKITPEDLIIVQGYWAPTVGDRIRLEKVLLAGSTDFTLLGRPMLPRDLVRIEATVIEKKLSHLKLNFWLIKRKNTRRLSFYKTPYTMVRINSIEFDGLVNERKEIEGERNTIVY